MNIIIFGGTGTLGQELSKILSKNKSHKVYIVSRCELRQKSHRKEFDFNYVIGDVTNSDWRDKLPDVADYVINLAASKHVEVCEENVEYAVKVNYEGVINTYRYAREVGARYLMTSTDKAVAPVTAYGYAKALGEKYLADKDDAAIFMWPNVLGSRGSVLHIFTDKLLKGETIPITDENMTRWWVHVEDVAKFMWKFRNTKNKKNIPPNMGSCRLIDLLDVLASELGVKEYTTEVIGIRGVEKIHEQIYWLPGRASEYTSKDYMKFKKDQIRELVRRVL